jgi:hypothetical protein
VLYLRVYLVRSTPITPNRRHAPKRRARKLAGHLGHLPSNETSYGSSFNSVLATRARGGFLRYPHLSPCRLPRAACRHVPMSAATHALCACACEYIYVYVAHCSSAQAPFVYYGCDTSMCLVQRFTAQLSISLHAVWARFGLSRDLAPRMTRVGSLVDAYPPNLRY